MTADERSVLVSGGRCAAVFHDPLGETTLGHCDRNHHADEFERVPPGEARERGYRSCRQCPFGGSPTTSLQHRPAHRPTTWEGFRGVRVRNRK